MSPEARELFDQLRPKIQAMAPESVEVAEQKSVSYHSQEFGFFREVLPRKRRLTLLLPLDLSEITDPAGLATDAREWKFLFYAKYEGGVLLRIARAPPATTTAAASSPPPQGRALIEPMVEFRRRVFIRA